MPSLHKKSLFQAILVCGLIVSIGVAASYNQSQAQISNNKSLLTATPKQPKNVPFPTNLWKKSSFDKVTQEKIDKIITPSIDGKVQQLGQTQAFVIVQNGEIKYEKYAKGFDERSKFQSWSVAKSITSALFGIAVFDGKLKLEDKIKDPRWKAEDIRNEITYSQALRMSDGLKWREDNYGADPIHNDAAIMLYGKGKDNIVKYAASRPIEHQAGEMWNYSSGISNIIAAGVSRSLERNTLKDPTGKYTFRNFIYDRLFYRIGMNQTAAEFDASGNFYGSSMVYATAQDYARFGLLFLRDGVWDNERILPKGFVDFVRTPAPADKLRHYGAHWWLSTNSHKGLLKDGPYDSFEAQGHNGQLIMIIPSMDLVIVRLGFSPQKQAWDGIGAQMSQIVKLIPESK